MSHVLFDAEERRDAGFSSLISPHDVRQRGHNNMAWVFLILAGLLETGWAIGLKYTDGFTRLVPSVLTLAGIAASMILLAISARTIPIGTAYAVWVGIGAVGAVILGIVLFDEPRSALRLLFLALLIVALIGLKVTSASSAAS